MLLLIGGQHKMFGRKKIYNDFVDLSVGRIFIKPLTHGLLNEISKKATIIENIINNNLYFELLENKIVCLKKRQLYNLTPEDGTKLRDKIKTILQRHGVMTIKQDKPTEEKVDIFKKTDTQWFDKQKTKFDNIVKK